MLARHGSVVCERQYNNEQTILTTYINRGMHLLRQPYCGQGPFAICLFLTALKLRDRTQAWIIFYTRGEGLGDSERKQKSCTLRVSWVSFPSWPGGLKFCESRRGTRRLFSTRLLGRISRLRR